MAVSSDVAKLKEYVANEIVAGDYDLRWKKVAKKVWYGEHKTKDMTWKQRDKDPQWENASYFEIAEVDEV